MSIQANSLEADAGIATLAQEAVGKIASFPKDHAQHREILYDLKEDIVKARARACRCEDLLEEDLQWRLAHDMPDFSTAELYAKRYSLPSMAGIVFLGFFAGGVLSTLLGLIGMGGEIIRVAAVLGMLYGAEHLSADPKARGRLLVFLGLGGLAVFAAQVVAGALRLASWVDFKKAVFGNGASAGPFRRLYMLLGAAFLFVFLSKKTATLDVPAFRVSLERQARERARWLTDFFEVLIRLNAELAALQDREAADPASPACPRNDCPLALGLVDMLDHFDGDARRFLAGQLALAGYAPGDEQSHVIWDDAEHAELYDTVGVVDNGDNCRILRRYSKTGSKIAKGRVQREAGGRREPGA